MPHLLVAVLGHRNSGKTTTWKTLFGSTVKTGRRERRLYLNKAQYVNVFLVSGSPEERDKYVGKIISVKKPGIVLCSTQYVDGVQATYDYFFKNEYQALVQWLNPGHSDSQDYPDELRLLPYLIAAGATVQVRSGKGDPANRVRELKQHILGWATYHDLVHTEFEA